MQDHCLDATSDCCDAPTSSDIKVCSECGEHCDIITEEEEIENQTPTQQQITDRLCKQLKEYILSEAELKRKIKWFSNYKAYMSKMHYVESVEASEYANNCEK